MNLNEIKNELGEANALTYSKFSTLVTKIFDKFDINKRKKAKDDDFSDEFRCKKAYTEADFSV